MKSEVEASKMIEEKKQEDIVATVKLVNKNYKQK